MVLVESPLYVRDSKRVLVWVETYCWKLVAELLRLALRLAETGPHPADSDAFTDAATVVVSELVS